eukprot:Gb_40409 [translate_table: standard]
MAIPRRFKGKVVVVTASTQGIGFGIAEHLGLEGVYVVVLSCKQKNMVEAVEKLRAKEIEVLGDVVAHLSKDSSIIIVSSITAYQPQAMMSICGFLEIKDASYITGETLVVTGGLPSRL